MLQGYKIPKNRKNCNRKKLKNPINYVFTIKNTQEFGQFVEMLKSKKQNPVSDIVGATLLDHFENLCTTASDQSLDEEMKKL